MENSRHERALVVIASYVIGFTSAFIAFGIGELPSQTTYTANVIDAEVVSETTAAVSTPRPGSSYQASIYIDNVGLYVVSQNGKQLLSARKDSPEFAAVVIEDPQPGIAVKIVEAELSRDSRFVYFCEQRTETATTCSAYVYSIEEEKLYPLTVRGSLYEPQVATHSSLWTNDDRLSVDLFNSISPDRPWDLR